MSFSSGTYSLYATGNPVVTNTTISSTWANNTLNDIATALSTCLLKDGTQTATASIGFAQGIDVTTAATTPSTTFACFNTNATTVNAFGAASVALNIGHASAAAAFPGGISIPTGKTLSGAGAINISGNITGAAISGTTLTASGLATFSALGAGADFTSSNATSSLYFTPTGGDRYRIGGGIGAVSDFVIYNATDSRLDFSISGAGTVTITSLAGTGTRAVVVDANGVLSAP